MGLVFLSGVSNHIKIKKKFLKHSRQTEIYWYLVFAWGLGNFLALLLPVGLQFKHSLNSLPRNERDLNPLKLVQMQNWERFFK